MHLPDLCVLIANQLIDPVALAHFARTCKAAHAATRPLLARLRPRFESERLLRHLNFTPCICTTSIAIFTSLAYISPRNHRIILRERWHQIERRTTSIRKRGNGYFVMQSRTYACLWANAITWKACINMDELIQFLSMYTYAGKQNLTWQGRHIPVTTPLFIKQPHEPTVMIPPAVFSFP